MGYKPGYICGKNYSMEMSKELKINKVLESKNSLLVQGTLSNPMFYNSLSKFSTVKKEVFYQTIKTKKESKGLRECFLSLGGVGDGELQGLPV